MNPVILGEIRLLAAGVRILAAALVLILGFCNLCTAFLIGIFRPIFQDMFGGRNLPLFTALIVQGKIPLLILTIAMPVLTLVILWRVSNHKTALCVASVVAVLCLVQICLTLTGLSLPLMTGPSHVLSGSE